MAERIAQERVENCGQTAGYHIKLEAKKSAQTRILLMTTGVLLRKLQMEGELGGISHVFVDEVNERDIHQHLYLLSPSPSLISNPTNIYPISNP